jgi:hypothetical protein
MHMSQRILASLLSLAALAASGSAQNLLTNPGFESGLTGWTTFGPNVYSEPANPPAVAPHTGTRICKMFGQFLGSFNVTGAFQTFPAQPGQVYQIDCWSRHFAFDPLAGTGGPNDNIAVMRIAFFDAGGVEISGAERRILDGTFPTSTWIDNAPVNGTAPAGTATVQALILFIQPTVGTGAAQFDDVTFSLQNGVLGTYPGSNEDLVFASAIGGAALSSGPGNDVKNAPGGSLIELNVSSPGGLFNLQGYYIVGYLFPTGSPLQQQQLPNIWVNIPTHFLLVDGSPRPLIGQPLIHPNGGTSCYFITPSGLAGTSVMVQGVCISPNAANTVYAATDAHELRLQ